MMTTDNKWEMFARDTPFWYVLTRNPKNNRKKFWESGKEKTAAILAETQDLLHRRDTVIEIGCGVGRLLIPMSFYFKKSIGVDISETMVDLAKKYSKEYAHANDIQFYLTSEDWPEHKADFIYSYFVFQHIEDLAVIEDSIDKISKALSKDGIGYFQFDTRKPTLAYRIVEKMPDYLLPKQWRKGIRRIRRKRDTLIQLFEKHGCRVVREIKPHSDHHIFLITAP